MSTFSTNEANLAAIGSLRDQFRAESNCQIVHDSLHERPGWTVPYLLGVDGVPAGFAAIAVGGPWKSRRTLFDFYLQPPYRSHFRPLLDTFLTVSAADSLEIQTNLPLASELLAACGRDLAPDAIVFADAGATSLPANGAVLRRQTSERQTAAAIRHRAGTCEWTLEFDGMPIGKGGLLFHYNVPYADLAMEIDGPFRRRGFGGYLVQEIKRQAHLLGALPAARSSPTNFPSHRTLQKAGFKLVAKILTGEIKGVF